MTIQLKIKLATYAKDRELWQQYSTLRQNFFDERERDQRRRLGLPESPPKRAEQFEPKEGDREAEFLLAIEETPDGEKVRGGFRLNKYIPGQPIPADKVESATPEKLFPTVPNIRARYRLLNVDGAVFGVPRSEKKIMGDVIDVLLGCIAKKVRDDRIDAVHMIVANELATRVWSYFDPQPTGLLRRIPPLRHKENGVLTCVPITDCGTARYENHLSRILREEKNSQRVIETEKPVLVIIVNEELKDKAVKIAPSGSSVAMAAGI